MKNLAARIRVITGATKKQSHALREIGELLESLNAFQEEYGDPGKVFDGGNVVKARVNVSSLMHRIRTSEKIFKQSGNKQLTPLIMDVYDKLEGVRVDVYTPHKGRFSFSESLAALHASVESLAGAVSGTEVM